MTKKIIITRTVEGNKTLEKFLESPGVEFLSLPSIEIIKNNIAKIYEYDLNSYSWVVFTSKYAIRFFNEEFLVNKKDLLFKIGVVGTSSKKLVEELFMKKVDFIPSIHNGDCLAKEFPSILGKEDRVLVVSGNLSCNLIINELEVNKIKYDLIEIYKNEKISFSNSQIENLLLLKSDDLIFIFFSSSAVRNTFENLKEIKDIFSNAIFVSIGPSTTETLLSYGLKNIVETSEQSEQAIVDEVNRLLNK